MNSSKNSPAITTRRSYPSCSSTLISVSEAEDNTSDKRIAFLPQVFPFYQYK